MDAPVTCGPPAPIEPKMKGRGAGGDSSGAAVLGLENRGRWKSPRTHQWGLWPGESAQGPLTGSPLGPGGDGGAVLIPKESSGAKPRSDLRLGSWLVVQAFRRGDAWHWGLWAPPVLLAF